jgi:hypothetical protein
MKKMMMIVCTLFLAVSTITAKPAGTVGVGLSFLAGKQSDGWIGSKVINCLLAGTACTWSFNFGAITSGTIDAAGQPSVISNGTVLNMNVDELSSFRVSENHSFPLSMTGTKKFVNLPIQDAPRVGPNTFQFKLEISDKPLYTIQ